MTVQADSNGLINGLMTVPADTIPAGAKLIEFFGAADPSPSYGSAVFVSSGTITNTQIKTTRRRVTTTTRSVHSSDIFNPGTTFADRVTQNVSRCGTDPLAQGFMVDETTQLSFVDVWAEGPRGTTDVVLQVREMVNGYPGPRILAEAIKLPAQMVLDGDTAVAVVVLEAPGTGGTDGEYSLSITGGGGSGATGRFRVRNGSVEKVWLTAPGNGYTSAPTLGFTAAAGLTGATGAATIGDFTRFSWEPTVFYADVEYCFVALCNDAIWRLRVAIIGDVDGPTQHRISAQPYTVGTLFSSSNNSTWTAHQERDMRFRLGGPTHIETQKTIILTPDGLTVTNCDYIGLMGAVDLPSPDTSVRFVATLPDLSTVTLPLNRFLLLPSRQTGEINITATLTGTDALTPVLYPDFQVLVGTSDATSLYVSRAIDIQPSPGSHPTKVTVLFDYKMPGTSTITVHAWDVNASAWVAVPVDSGAYILPMAGDWQEKVLTLNTLNTVNRWSQLKITLTGDAWNRPEVRRFRAIFNDNPP